MTATAVSDTVSNEKDRLRITLFGFRMGIVRQTDGLCLLRSFKQNGIMEEKTEKENTMKEIKLENNPTGLKIYINGIPDITDIPKDELNVCIAVWERIISEHYERDKNIPQKYPNSISTVAQK